MENQREMKEITEILKAAYHWGRDNGEGRSDKNFNDFLNTFVVSKLEHLVNQEVERRIAERMPSEEEILNEVSQHLLHIFPFMDEDIDFVSNIDAQMGARWVVSRLTNPGDSQKTEGGENG